jgi:hypothetical protein
MKHSILLALAALTICSVDPASAAGAVAPFGCDARPGQTCFFKLFLGPRATRIVQLPAGMKVNVPGVEIGRDRYCIDLGRPPRYKCAQKIINAKYNN